MLGYTDTDRLTPQEEILIIIKILNPYFGNE